MSDLTKKAFQDAEKELEDKEVTRLKSIITHLLTRKKEKELQRDKMEEEIKVIKQDIEDFKAGRLDKIKERHDLNPAADKSSPITITIINDNTRQIYAQQPWKWNYAVALSTGGGGGSAMYTTSGTNSVNWQTSVPALQSSMVAYLSGQAVSTFTGGTYTINGGTVNL